MQQNKAGWIIEKKFWNFNYTMIHENKTKIKVLKIFQKLLSLLIFNKDKVWFFTILKSVQSFKFKILFNVIFDLILSALSLHLTIPVGYYHHRKINP